MGLVEMEQFYLCASSGQDLCRMDSNDFILGITRPTLYIWLETRELSAFTFFLPGWIFTSNYRRGGWRAYFFYGESGDVAGLVILR